MPILAGLSKVIDYDISDLWNEIEKFLTSFNQITHKSLKYNQLLKAYLFTN